MDNSAKKKVADNKMAAFRSQCRWFVGYFKRQADQMIQEFHNDQ